MTGLSARTRLGERLRACRRAAHFTQPELAMRLGVVQSTISKIETGKARAPEEVLLAWLDHTGVDDELRAELVELAKASTEVSDWPHLYARGWEAHQKSYSELERSASRELIFQNAVVPGLLQTAAYTSFLLTTVLGLSPEDVGVGVTSRLARQAVLYEPKTRIRAVVTEAVLRHRMGGPSVMPEQLARLAEVSTLPTVEFGIIPIDTAMPSRYGASFDLFEEVDGSGESLVIVELESGEVREADPGRVAAYRQRHDIYWAAAITGGAATDYVGTLGSRLTTELFR